MTSIYISGVIEEEEGTDIKRIGNTLNTIWNVVRQNEDMLPVCLLLVLIVVFLFINTRRNIMKRRRTTVSGGASTNSKSASVPIDKLNKLFQSSP
jgi:hypothetical protein